MSNPYDADVTKGSVSFAQSDGGPFRLRVIVWVPLRLDTSGRVPHAIGSNIVLTMKGLYSQPTLSNNCRHAFPWMT